MKENKQMKKYSFKNDYGEGCHNSILKILADTNLEQQEGYGEDYYSIEAKRLIRKEINNNSADIHFVSGGTQANLIIISSLLRPYEAVISASTGHINTHEAGAIEAVGHKIISVDSDDAKLYVHHIQAVLDEHINPPHMVKPKMVYISNTTELGSIYSRKELEGLYSFCKKNKLLLFLDGARLGSAISSEHSDVSIEDVANNTDIFYFGGTKNGALLGEAIIITNDSIKEDFDYNLKQKGALISKGRILGIQFYALFTDKLFQNLASHANKMADKIADAIKISGYMFLNEPVSNQIFPILPNKLIAKLHNKYEFYVWKTIDNDNSAVRIITSWATEENIVDDFINDLRK